MKRRRKKRDEKPEVTAQPRKDARADRAIQHPPLDVLERRLLRKERTDDDDFKELDFG